MELFNRIEIGINNLIDFGSDYCFRGFRLRELIH